MNRYIMNRNRNGEPLTNEQIQKAAPSAFAGQEHSSRSDRYTFIPTVEVLAGMRQAGFAPVFASQSSSRIEGKELFTKHMIRFRAVNEILTQVGDTTVEVALRNSHDGTSAYELSLGAFRLACLNGMMVSEGLVETVKVRHTGNIIERVIESTRTLIQQAPRVVSAIKLWKSIELLPNEQQFLAEGALRLRYDEDEAPIPASRLLTVQRSEDQKNDLWTTFNRIQENAVQGGLRYFKAPEDGGRDRRMRTREVKGIDQNTRLNRELWTLAEKMAELKVAELKVASYLK
jgi:Domain of unknown function (DUF932)